MNKGFALVGAAIVAIYVFFQVFSALGGAVPGIDQSDLASGPQMRGCVRQLEKEGASVEQASAICGCTFREFEKRGLSLFDAMRDENFAAMSEITRSCAAVHGFEVADSEAVADDWG